MSNYVPARIDTAILKFINGKVNKTVTLQYWFKSKEVKVKLFNDDFSESIDMTHTLKNYDIWSEPKPNSGPLHLGKFGSWGQYVQATSGLAGLIRAKCPSKTLVLQLMENENF